MLPRGSNLLCVASYLAVLVIGRCRCLATQATTKKEAQSWGRWEPCICLGHGPGLTPPPPGNGDAQILVTPRNSPRPGMSNAIRSRALVSIWSAHVTLGVHSNPVVPWGFVGALESRTLRPTMGQMLMFLARSQASQAVIFHVACRWILENN